MKKYLMGLALTGLASRMSKKSRSVMPWTNKTTIPKRAPSFLLGAGVGAGLAYFLSQKLSRK